MITRFAIAAFISLAVLGVAPHKTDAPQVQTAGPLTCPAEPVAIGSPVVFSANLNRTDEQLPLKWAVSTGRISRGQSSPSITVDTNGVNDQSLAATLEIRQGDCIRTYSCSVVLVSER
jgi:hypothetical protein